ncbi:MFS transporter [Streptomyces sp. NPDC094049]|uniref:MFS transporter n=1 Tax=Streptomyces sp. NPDC094049 TaxID=3154987 RepID=UPI003323737B
MSSVRSAAPASPPGPVRRAGPRQWWALVALTVPVLLMSIDLTVLSMAVPALSTDLAPTASQLLWIIDVYGVFLAGLLILMGSLGDRIGRRRLLLTGAVAFGAASLLAAFAWNAEVLILARALLGLGGATLMPSTLSLIRNIFEDPAQRRRAISVWAAAFAGGAGLGPVVGGLLLEHFWWGSVFLINLPVMALLLAVGPFLLPESRDPRPGPFDLLSAALLIGAVLAVVFGFKEAGKLGWGVQPAAWLAGGTLVAALFAARQRRLAQPLIDLALLRSLPFGVAVLTNIAGVFAMTGMLYFFPQYVQIVLGRSALEAGLWALPLATGAIIGSLTVPALARRFPAGLVIGLGLALASSGYLLLSLLDTDGVAALAFAGGALLGGGVGLANTLANDVIVSAAPPGRAGAAAGISETAYELGGAMGTAVLGSVGAQVYASRVLADLPAQTPPEAAGAATQTLAAAERVAASLPPAQGRELLGTAHSAFVDAMSQTFLTGGLIVAAAAAAAALALRTYRVTAATATH